MGIREFGECNQKPGGEILIFLGFVFLGGRGGGGENLLLGPLYHDNCFALISAYEPWTSVASLYTVQGVNDTNQL